MTTANDVDQFLRRHANQVAGKTRGRDIYAPSPAAWPLVLRRSFALPLPVRTEALVERIELVGFDDDRSRATLVIEARFGERPAPPRLRGEGDAVNTRQRADLRWHALKQLATSFDDLGPLEAPDWVKEIGLKDLLIEDLPATFADSSPAQVVQVVSAAIRASVDRPESATGVTIAMERRMRHPNPVGSHVTSRDRVRVAGEAAVRGELLQVAVGLLDPDLPKVLQNLLTTLDPNGLAHSLREIHRNVVLARQRRRPEAHYLSLLSVAVLSTAVGAKLVERDPWLAAKVHADAAGLAREVGDRRGARHARASRDLALRAVDVGRSESAALELHAQSTMDLVQILASADKFTEATAVADRLGEGVATDDPRWVWFADARSAVQVRRAAHAADPGVSAETVALINKLEAVVVDDDELRAVLQRRRSAATAALVAAADRDDRRRLAADAFAALDASDTTVRRDLNSYRPLDNFETRVRLALTLPEDLDEVAHREVAVGLALLANQLSGDPMRPRFAAKLDRHLRAARSRFGEDMSAALGESLVASGLRTDVATGWGPGLERHPYG